MPIKLLDTHTINKIAAGEVVERPASVVKELVENSIDAKASSITVEIKNGGIDLIRVTDNGVGIPSEEVEIAFLRHATSKIETELDLNKVLSLGFRGEALASIAAVSSIELISKTSESLTGKRVEVQGGRVLQSEEIAAPSGTTFIMRHLFMNVPARKEFLKSPSSEGARITDYMYKLALGHPQISFKYIQNNKLLFQTLGNYDLNSAVLKLYGKEISKECVPFVYEEKGIKLTGLLGKPTLTKGNRHFEFFFINGRFIKSPLLQRALESAYKTLVMVGKFPFGIIHLEINPEEVDVNVHPTKLEVRFKQEQLIYDVVYQGIKNSLQEQILMPTIVKPIKEEKPKPAPKEEWAVQSLFEKPNPQKTFSFEKIQHEMKNQVVKETPTASFIKLDSDIKPDTEVINSKATTIQSKPTNNTITQEVTSAKQSSQQQVQEPKEKRLQLGLDYAIIGQLFQTYWLVSYEEKVLLIDQHAAHERVLYERYMKAFTKGTVQTQMLLVPETISLTPREFNLLEEHQQVLEGLGFRFEHFGENAVLIREVPYLFNHPIGTEELKEMLEKLDVLDLKNAYDLKEDTIITMSCKHAVKAKDKLEKQECMALIKELLELENPYSCPHGRPTILVITEKEIEKLFKRI
jgi:DNA mismatch repair protein MutL